MPRDVNPIAAAFQLIGVLLVVVGGFLMSTGVGVICAGAALVYLGLAGEDR